MLFTPTIYGTEGIEWNVLLSLDLSLFQRFLELRVSGKLILEAFSSKIMWLQMIPE